MFAIARFYPPSSDGQRMSKEEIKKDLIYLGIRYGINEAVIDEFIENPHYCTNYIIAKGKTPIQGKDAVITYHFNTNRRSKPRRNEDGSVDFHKLDNISHIKAGDVLATLIPEEQGEAGISVKGAAIRPRKVEKKTLKHGINAVLSEDGLSMISQVNGHAILEGDKVFVSNVYDVPGDVDNSTGDISYEGNVLVHGNVRTGFKIEATGNVEVLGGVEGAVINAGGQIVLHHGVQGMGKGVLNAGGNIVARFIESAAVKAGGYVEADNIIQSDVSAKGDIIVDGSKGFIIGGSVKAESLISAKTIGSAMGITTYIEVGTDPELKDRLACDTELIKEKEPQLKQLGLVVTAFKQKQELGALEKTKLSMYIKAIEDYKKLSEEVMALKTEIEEISERLGENNNACIKVSRDIFAGVKICVADEYMIVNKMLSHCRLVKDKGEIQILPL